MCEHSSVAQTAALRREARRRKILENSTSRLKLIEGANSSVENTSSQSSLEPKPEIKSSQDELLSGDSSKASIYSKLNEIVKENEDLKEISDFLMRDAKELEEEEVIEEHELPQDVNLVKGKSFLDVFLEKRLHYVLLAIIVNLLLFFNVGYLFYENIFCPFYTLKTIEMISRRTTDKEEFQPILFLFMAGLPKRIQKFTKVSLTILLASLSDLCMYIFTFVIGTKIINTEL